MAGFIKGMDLCQRFYREAVRPVLNEHFPELTYSAGRLGPGSDVLGYDTPMSMDHDWGPRTTLFLSAEGFDRYRGEINDALRRHLPREVSGFATFYSANEDGTARPQDVGDETATHAVDITTISRFFTSYIGADPLGPLTNLDWLCFSPQHLRTISSGRAFHDGLGQLETARQSVRWYPHDIWLYLMANQWRRIDQEEPFLGRCGEMGDELGSQLVGGRMVTEIMRLCFLMAKSHPPYFKWFGTAFSRLPCSKEVGPLLQRVLSSTGWEERERHLSSAYLAVSRLHNQLGITPHIQPEVSAFYGRPFQVPHAGRFVDALLGSIESTSIAALPKNVGAVWQFADSTDVLTSSGRSRALMKIYES